MSLFKDFLSLMPKMSQFIAESTPNRVKLTYDALICHYFDLGDMNWRLFAMLKKLGDKSGDFGAVVFIVISIT